MNRPQPELNMTAKEYTVKYLVKKFKYCTSVHEMNEMAEIIYNYVVQWQVAYKYWRDSLRETI